MDGDCEAPARTALGVIGKTKPAVDNGLRHLAALAAEPAAHHPQIGRRGCDEARDLVDRLGRGPGRRNYAVYWSPPPPPDARVLYVGLSRALDSRCSSHPNQRSASLETLNLPPLLHAEATSVEEALISHFGTAFEESVPPGSIGQLQNRIHAISALRPDYCARLLLGQAILSANAYARYTVAHFTRSARCPTLAP